MIIVWSGQKPGVQEKRNVFHYSFIILNYGDGISPFNVLKAYNSGYVPHRYIFLMYAYYSYGMYIICYKVLCNGTV